MARPKEFDQDEALRKAMQIFWSRGYEATSIQDLVTSMGINRQSIYDTFGDKHTLYLQALDCYHQLETRKLAKLLDESRSVKRALRQLFGSVVKDAFAGGRRGCFVGNAIGERGGRCKQTTARTARNIAAMEDAFYRALQHGHKRGELVRVRDSRAMARFLCGSFQGLLLMSKVTRDRKTLEDVIKITLSVLD